MSNAATVGGLITGPLGGGVCAMLFAKNLEKTRTAVSSNPFSQPSLLDAAQCGAQGATEPGQLVCYNVAGSTMGGLVGAVDPAVTGTVAAFGVGIVAYLIVEALEKRTESSATD